MKFKTLLFTLLLTIPMLQAQDRYVDEVFDSVNVISNFTYGVNITIITGAPALDTLDFDFYEPKGDTVGLRPLVIVLHTGTFLPPGFTAPVGSRHDYSNQQISTRLAKRGYAVGNIDYRLGWNPIAPDDITRRATIIQAAYRGIQDIYSFIRYMHVFSEATNNSLRIDFDKVAIFGIGTGGFVGFNMAVLDNWREEIFIDKFRNPVDGTPFIDTLLLGDIENTQAGLINVPLHVGYENDFHFTFGLDGALGDSSWADVNGKKIPMVCGGVVNHPTTPFGIDPITGEINCDMPVFSGAGTDVFVVNIAGTACLLQKANELGYNASVNDRAWDDDVSNAVAERQYAQEHLWPIHLPGAQAGPWEYWDSTFWKLVPSPQPDFDNIHQAGLATNPNMSMEKANNYIDTALWFFSPRACAGLGLEECKLSSVENLSEVEYDFTIAPNPTSGDVRLSIEGGTRLTKVMIFDMLGKVVQVYDNVNAFSVDMNVANLPPGMYGVRAELGKLGYLSSKLVIQN